MIKLSTYDISKGFRSIVVWGTGRDAQKLVPIILDSGYEIDFFVSGAHSGNSLFFNRPVCPKQRLCRDEHFVLVGSTQ